MNERQRDLFLYIWSRRRQRGQTPVSLMGAGIGALGGLAFALILGGQMSFERGGYTGLSAIIPIVEQGGRLLLLSVAAFGALGFVGANRVFAAQEAMYQSILATGARVPNAKPAMQASDRGPAIAVAIAVGLIMVFIIVLFAMYG